MSAVKTDVTNGDITDPLVRTFVVRNLIGYFLLSSSGF